ncbi:MAG: retroviral-like aspartic protease family protein [Gammaproteobacteria bacterium]|nr:retroviral-like aspartic protease family protein [Gammaproteobacteria bacterium]
MRALGAWSTSEWRANNATGGFVSRVLMRRALWWVLAVSLALNLYLLWPRLQALFTALPQYSGQPGQSDSPGLDSNDNAVPHNVPRSDALRGEDLQLLFDAGDFKDALLGYQILSRHDFWAAQRLKKTWLATGGSWLEQTGAQQQLQDFLQAALDVQPNDIDFRRLLAQSYIAGGRHEQVLQAIDIYYQLLHESPQAMQGELVSEIQQLVKQQVGQLSEQQAWQPLIRLAERLLWHEPLHPPYLFIYARALVKVERFASARNSLRSVIYDEYYGARAQQMLNEIALLDLSDQATALQRQGAHYRVQARINGRYPVSLMIDTGASLTVISPAVLRQLGVSPAPTFVRNASINTAGGKVNAAVYRVESFSIGDYSVPNMEFVLLDIDDGNNGHGLLGMNFLRNFAFQIDQKNNLLLLSAN